MASISTLPLELLAHIVSFADRPSLKCLRQTCRFLSTLATKQLFSSIRLFPDESSYEAIKNILNSPSLRTLAKRALVNTVEEDYEPDDETDKDCTPDFQDAIRSLEHFPNARSATLRFDRNCFAADGLALWPCPETSEYREEVLESFFSWLAALKTPIEEVSIWNLQCISIPNRALATMLGTVLSTVKSLRLQIVTEWDHAAPESSLHSYALHASFASFPTTWLKPSSSCQHLTLSCDRQYGFIPYLNLTDVHFPRLQHLVLNKFTFAIDSHLTWITSHAATLTSLYLNDCSILYDIGINDTDLPNIPLSQCEMEQRAYPETNPEFPDLMEDAYFYSYPKRWHHFFDTFRTSLPRLRDFQMGLGSDEGDAVPTKTSLPFEREREIRMGLVADRYLAFYFDDYVLEDEILEDKASYMRLPPGCDEEDRVALRALLRETGQGEREGGTRLGGVEGWGPSCC
ncbi:hypothetical protein BJX65DRAFT_319526 [Aspergillus insuetus]